MKLHIPASVAVLLAVCLVTSCVKPTILSVSQTALSFDSSGGNQVVVLTANKLWTASSNQSWLRVSPSSGEGDANISISCAPNDTYDNRTGTIKIVSEELSQTISVTQSEAKGLIVSQTEYNLSNAAQTISVEVKTNDRYSIDIDASCRDWIKQNSTKGLSSYSIQFDISKNETYSDRNGKITIKQASGSMMSTVVVKQSQTNGLFADKTLYELTYEIQKLDIKVKSNVKYEVSIDNACKNWISYLGTKSLTESTVSLAIAENEGNQREGKIILNYGNLQETVVIKQASGLVVFEDNNFKAYCVQNFDKNGDHDISFAEARNITCVAVITDNISSMRGIEYMPNLEELSCGGKLGEQKGKLKSLNISNNASLKYLYCSANQLTSLDVSQNAELIKLYCDENYLTSLDVSKNTLLVQLWCSTNQLKSLDVSKNTNLRYFSCGNNQLTKLDVTKNSKITWLGCWRNQLTSLDISQNIELSRLECDNNQLTSLDVDHNKALTILSCDNNQLTSLDISNNIVLQSLYFDNNKISRLDMSNKTSIVYLGCRNNQLTNLDISKFIDLKDLYCENNLLTILDLSDNHALEYVSCHNNPYLTQIWLKSSQKVNLVYDNNIAKIYYVDGVISFRDKNFKQYCIQNFDTNRDGELSLLEARDIRKLNVKQFNISSLEGIEYMTNLTELYCELNQLTSLDVSNNAKLTKLSCSANQIKYLDVTNNTALTGLWCNDNQLTSIDVSQNIDLVELQCGYNYLTTIDVRKNTALKMLGCFGNQISSIDISNNTVLTNLDCRENRLTSLDIRRLMALEQFDCSNNQLRSIDVSMNKALWFIGCHDNYLTNLDLSNNTGLRQLWCYSNQLSRLDVSNNTAIWQVHCYSNPQLKEIWLKNNQTITDFKYDSNISTICYVNGNSSGSENGHYYVDLGLPSGVKWATCNVGANSPEEYGNYYAWGETSTKNEYSFTNYKWYKGMNGDHHTYTKYIDNDEFGIIDNKICLEFADDAARMNWGGKWRMPTADELEELRTMCNWTWTTQSGKKGFMVTSKINGKSIFLPAAGHRYFSDLIDEGTAGYYWSSYLYTHSQITYGAEDFRFGSYGVAAYSGDYREYGQSIRPVL